MLGDKIRQHRKLNHLSQEELAEKLGVSRQSISLWENNQTQPTIENIVVLAKLLHVSTDELLTTSNEENNGGYSEPIFIPTPPVAPAAPQPIAPPTIPNNPETDREKAVAPKSKKKNYKKTIIIVGVILVVLLSVGLLAAWLLSNGNNLGNTHTLSAEEIYTKISPSVVEISAESATEINTGTGFFFDEKGTVITNYHVIENCQQAEITLSNGSTYQVTAVLGYDADRDIAILSTSCKTSKPLTIRSATVKTGEKVYALGSSLGLTGSLSDGIVSSDNREVEGNVYIQTTAPISQGNSGGPLVDAKGEVIGIICASFTDGQNLNLAIPIAAVQNISLTNSITLDKLFSLPEQEVEWISDWRFSYYEDEDTYVLLFQLADKHEKPMSASGTVEIRIVNDDNVTVYNKPHRFTFANFEEWIYDDTDEMYLATIYISPQSIDSGSTEYGTVYFEVYGNGYAFEECTVETDCLPTGVIDATDTKTVGVRTITFSDKFTAEYVLAKWESGDRSEKSLIALMDKYGSQQGGGQLYTISPGEFVEEIDEWCFSPTRKVGDYAIIENVYGFSWCYISSLSSSSMPETNSSTPPATDPPATTQPPTTSSTTATTKYICLDPSCNNTVNNDGEYCSTHRCATPGCEYSRSSGSNYCTVCACYTVGCNNGRIANGYYCTTHTCSANGCTSEKASSSDYCYFHQPNTDQGNNSTQQTNPPETEPPATTQPTQYTCLKSTCKNVVSKSGEYCSEHKCANSNCSFQKDYNSDYCGSCTCNTASCKKPHIENGYHCTDHTCKASGCTSEKQYSSDYCITHKCNSCNNQKIENGSYCVDHTCSKNGCNWDKQYGSEYCFKHTCMAGTCKKETKGDGDYCEEHTCIVDGCTNQKLTSDYCYSHTP